MRKYFKYGKSYLIYGHDLFDNIHILNELIATIGDEYNEILYFDASPYGCYVEPKEKLLSKYITYDIFGYFRQKNLTQDVVEQYHELTTLYLDKFFADGKREHQQALKLLIERLFNTYQGEGFSLAEFYNILVLITQYSKANPYIDLINTLNKINKLKVDGKDVLNDAQIQELVFKARTKLEEYINDKPKENILNELNILINMHDKKIIKYYTKISENIYEYEQFDTPMDSSMHKINYYNYAFSKDFLTFLKLILETYLLKQKENLQNKRSLIILQSTQRELEFELYNLWDLHKYADVCYIEFNGDNLNKELNISVPIKFYTLEHKNLGLKNQKIKKDSVKLEVSEYSIVSS